jgi:hypothetical protein
MTMIVIMPGPGAVTRRVSRVVGELLSVLPPIVMEPAAATADGRTGDFRIRVLSLLWILSPTATSRRDIAVKKCLDLD